MHVRVVAERLAPGMQDRKYAHAGSEAVRIKTDLDDGPTRCAKEEVVQHPWVTAKERAQGVGNGEDDVEVADRQKLCLPMLQPTLLGQRLALRAVPISAGVVGGMPVVTRVAFVEMTTVGRSPAVDNPRVQQLAGTYLLFPRRLFQAAKPRAS